MTTIETLTDEQIHWLADWAWDTNNRVILDACQDALQGSPKARAICLARIQKHELSICAADPTELDAPAFEVSGPDTQVDETTIHECTE